MTKVTKDIVVDGILDLDQSTTPSFLKMGMYRLGCPVLRGGSIREACMVHGMNSDALVEKLNIHPGAK